MDFSALAAARYSVRKFKDIPVKKEHLDLILKTAHNAPTAGNRQPQRVLVITREEGLQKIDRCTKCRFGAPVVFLVCADTSACWVRPFDKIGSDWVDASIVTTQMMLQAADIGIGTTWVMYFEVEKLVQEFKLPQKLLPVALLVAGYPADDAVPADRHSLKNPADTMIFYEEFPAGI
jgi:nitroreductase